jgi:hypothetical protein
MRLYQRNNIFHRPQPITEAGRHCRVKLARFGLGNEIAPNGLRRMRPDVWPKSTPTRTVS